MEPQQQQQLQNQNQNLNPNHIKPKQNEDDQVIQHKRLTHQSLYYNFIQRYFTTYQSKTQLLHMHSNGLFVISVKKEKLPSQPKLIKFLLEDVSVRGKKKKGGIKVHYNQQIMQILCENGQIYKVLAMIQGTIIQINESLKVEDLGKQSGYTAIIMPNKKFLPQKSDLTKIQPGKN